MLIRVGDHQQLWLVILSCNKKNIDDTTMVNKFANAVIKL